MLVTFLLYPKKLFSLCYIIIYLFFKKKRKTATAEPAQRQTTTAEPAQRQTTAEPAQRQTSTAEPAPRQTVFKPTPVRLAYDVEEADEYNVEPPASGLQLDHPDQSLQGTYHWEECVTVKQ
ncbi:hypothetical protein DPMN_080877 [Dreissena polymorpha]|uniref:Uncharacterized protein n=1 Tax=Dreissena polymorpha TaxID=45954 RepID=A0A9D4BFG2_DREPO|nr:hypothetical protein DPMN_080877 [Dreissena polymorpha]